jgi:uncharacterized protein (TIGR02271 family)
MTEITNAYDWSGRTVVASDGEKIGKIDALYLDHQSDRPEWASVHTGLFGSKRSFVPLAGATPHGEDVRVPVFKDQVNSAPGIEPDGELSEQEETALFEHYGVPYTEQGTVTATGDAGNHAGAGMGNGDTGQDISGPSTDDAMTRSEEELRVGTASRERGRARLRKYVVTEEVHQTVPVQREEVRVEREPITDANIDRATDGPAISDEEHEMVLHEEEVVTEKRAVPKERIRLEKDTVTDEQQVSDEVRKERIDVDTDRD